jgi:hypothetical protein
MIFPVVELVDRFCIAKLKYKKTQGANYLEMDFYAEQMQEYDTNTISRELEQLYAIHEKIWNLESALKSGFEHQLTLEEIGRRAIEIRNLNNQRIQLKNTMAEKFGCLVREIKQDHLSE